MEETIGISDIMDFFKVTRQTVHVWLKTNPNFPRPIKVGKRVVWKKTEIEKYINELSSQ